MVGGIALGGYLYFDNVTIEVTEISMLQQKFDIESNSYQVVLSNSDNVQSDIKETENKSSSSTNSSKSSSGKSSSTGSSSSSTRKSSSGSSGGSGANVGAVTYTPKIQIPRTGIKYTIYSDMTVRNMERGVVILSTQNGLNEPGNTVISGHNTVNGRLFSRNDRIQIGDLIYITDSTGRKITYSVFDKYLTDPNDASYVDKDTEGDREISLTTCTNDSSQRLIILAIEI